MSEASETSDAFVALVDRATSRLGGDLELQMEVRRELLTHLAAAEAEHRAAGDPDPTAAACQALGEPGILADRLWQTHRTRIRRRVWARRASAMALPALACVVLAIAWSVLKSAAPMVELAMDHYGETISGQNPPPVLYQFTRKIADQKLDELTPEQRLFLPKHFNRNQINVLDISERAVDYARSRPADKVAAAHAALNAAWAASLYRNRPDLMNTAFEMIGKGQAIDDDNGLYPSLRALVLAENASENSDIQPASLNYPRLRGTEIQSQPCFGLKITNPERFAEARVALHEAAAAPRFEDYATELQARAGDSAPPAYDVAAVALQAALNNGQYSFARGAQTHYLITTMSHAAATDVAEGKSDAAIALLTDIHELAAKSSLLKPGGWRYLPSFYVDDICGYTAAILEHTGHKEDADGFNAWANEMLARKPTNLPIRTGPIVDHLQEVGFIGGSPSLSYGLNKREAFDPLRRAELHVIDRGAVAGIAILIGSIALVGSIVAWPFGPKPSLLLLPARGEVAMLLVSALLAGGIAYGGWAYFYGRALSNYGSHTPQLLYGYGVASIAILLVVILLNAMTSRARLAGLGIEVSRLRVLGLTTGVTVGTLLVWGVLVAAYWTWMLLNFSRVLVQLHLSILGLIVLATYLAMRLARRGDRGAIRINATILRTFVLRLALVAGLGVLTSATALRWAEKRQVARFDPSNLRRDEPVDSGSAAVNEILARANELSRRLATLAGG